MLARNEVRAAILIPSPSGEVSSLISTRAAVCGAQLMSLVKRARAGFEGVKPCIRERVKKRRPSQREVETFYNVANLQDLKTKLVMVIPRIRKQPLQNK